jgi:predicted nucleotidyltransferase
VEKVLAPAVSEPEGELPKNPPYHYVAKIEVSDLKAMVSFTGTEAGKAFVKSWSAFVDPTAVFTLGRDM